jgi:type IV pilus assembly protein PilW
VTINSQRGFTLVELMVALTIGLLLIAGMLQILLASRRSFDSQRASAHVLENARLAEFVLSHTIAHAGYRTSLTTDKADLFPPTSGQRANYPEGAYITGKANTNRKSDTLRVRFQAGGDVRGCLGSAIGSPGESARADLQFYVNRNHSLECRKYKSDGITAQPIVENVDRFKIRYGLDTDHDLAVDRYVTSPTAGQAGQIRSVRFQLLLHSADDDPALPLAMAQHFDLLDGTFFDVTDRHTRILIDRTVALRNPAP